MTPGRPVVLAFVREPVAGRVKRRLAATEGDAEALRLYRLLAQDVHGALRAAQQEGVADLVLCVDEGGDADRTRVEADLSAALVERLGLGALTPVTTDELLSVGAIR